VIDSTADFGEHFIDCALYGPCFQQNSVLSRTRLQRERFVSTPILTDLAPKALETRYRDVGVEARHMREILIMPVERSAQADLVWNECGAVIGGVAVEGRLPLSCVRSNRFGGFDADDLRTTRATQLGPHRADHLNCAGTYSSVSDTCSPSSAARAAAVRASPVAVHVASRDTLVTANVTLPIALGVTFPCNPASGCRCMFPPGACNNGTPLLALAVR
jgi:hypothetical protein